MSQSQYVSKLVENQGADAISWPPPGLWKDGDDISKLATFATNFDVSGDPDDSDLNSIPTPWARLLLFENALFTRTHPLHAPITNQWRGLLGAIALAGPLGLDVKVRTVDLAQYLNDPVARVVRTFLDLSPAAREDGDPSRWSYMQMILIDGVIVGATSPRTLIFTGVNANCPPSIPFQVNGRLSDPVAYYRRFGDTTFLGMFKSWLRHFTRDVTEHPGLPAFLGSVPGQVAERRHSMLIDELRSWFLQIGDVPERGTGELEPSCFGGAMYSILRPLRTPAVENEHASDLMLDGLKSIVIAPRPEASKIYTDTGAELHDAPVKLHHGRWYAGNERLPASIGFLRGVETLDDAAALFEDVLIELTLPQRPVAVHALSVELPDEQVNFLHPFKPGILDLLSSDTIAANTRIYDEPSQNSYRVELSIPLVNRRRLRVTRSYPKSRQVLNKLATPEMAAWPDFVSDQWHRYYYMKQSTAAKGEPLDFEPLAPAAVRSKGGIHWYSTRQPVQAFVGTTRDKKGLLLLNSNALQPAPDPASLWKVAIDFGSTHTRAFAVAVDDRPGDGFVRRNNAEVVPISIQARTLPLTDVASAALPSYFFVPSDGADMPAAAELKSILNMPESDAAIRMDWLPREGFAYLPSVLKKTDPSTLRYDLKWDSRTDNFELRNFLRSLLVMIDAEAFAAGARIVSVSRAFPSVFTPALRAKHSAEWTGLNTFMNDGRNTMPMEMTTEALTETVAVCRHLDSDHRAAVLGNVIAIDVGGGTTDMAVWSENRLLVQESLRMAGGVLSRFVESADGGEFRKWLHRTLSTGTFNLPIDAFLSATGERSGLAFHAALTQLERDGNLGLLIEQVQGSPEGHRFLAHVIYLFAAMSYYAGLLVRKKGLSPDRIHVYMCGKGGQFIRWIPGYETLCHEFITAGVAGPSGTSTDPEVITHLSETPKQEVGRGLLAENVLQGQKTDSPGLQTNEPPSVTVAESGYGNLKWSDDLDGERLKQIRGVPGFTDLLELNAFLLTFETASSTHRAASSLGIRVKPAAFLENLRQRLFGMSAGSVTGLLRAGGENALIEPLFITEAKVLLETATGNPVLFA